jgi:hypothetical protein
MEKRVRTLSVDMTNATDQRSSGGKKMAVAEGDYVMKVKDAFVDKVKKGPNEGKPIVVWVLEIEKPVTQRGSGQLWHRTGIWPEQLHNFRSIVEDIRDGKPLPKRMADIDLTKYVGQLVGVTCRDGDPYNGKVSSEVAMTFPASKFEEGEEEDEDATEGEDEESDEEEIESVDEEDI